MTAVKGDIKRLHRQIWHEKKNHVTENDGENQIRAFSAGDRLVRYYWRKGLVCCTLRLAAGRGSLPEQNSSIREPKE